VYAKGNENPMRHVVRRSGIEIFCHAVDLDQEPDILISQMRDLAQTIATARLTALVSPTVFAEEAG
jgi:5-methylcytosine-specific restriction enzyme subunit McrC